MYLLRPVPTKTFYGQEFPGAHFLRGRPLRKLAPGPYVGARGQFLGIGGLGAPRNLVYFISILNAGNIMRANPSRKPGLANRLDFWGSGSFRRR